MDHELFDTWTRSLVASTSRRRALKTVAGGALGGLLTRTGLGETAAACAARGKACQTNGGCCSGFCEMQDNDEFNRGGCGQRGSQFLPRCINGSCVGV
jgi:hypothetical protein